MSKTGSVYVYRYDYVAPVMKLMGLKACHVAEMIPLFDLKAKPYGTFTIGAGRTMKKIDTGMRRYWGAFAKYGAPDVPGLPEWKPYNERDRFTMVLDKEPRLVSDADARVRTRFDGIDRILI